MGILDKLAAALLSRLLQGWVDPVEPSQLNVTYAGEVQIERLSLRADALEQYELPVEVRCGVISRLRMVVPWKNLAAASTEIYVDGVYLVAKPTVRSSYDAKAEEQRMQNIKRKVLELVEAFGSGSAAADEEAVTGENGEESASFAARSFGKVMANLRVHVGSVHFRYEDNVSYGGRPFAVGFTLQSLEARACNPQWEPALLHWRDPRHRKLLVLKNAAVYWDSNCNFLVYESPDDLRGQLRDLIYRDDGMAPHHYYMLHPVSGRLRLMHENPMRPSPLRQKGSGYDLRFEFDRVALALEENMYRELIATVQMFDLYSRGLRFRRFRPAMPVQRDPLAWWRFLTQSLLLKQRTRRHVSTGRAVARSNFLRRTYVRVFKEHENVTVGWFSGGRVREQKKALRERLDRLENELDVRRILMFRAMARAYLKLEAAHETSSRSSSQARRSKSTPVVLELNAAVWHRIASEILEEYVRQRSQAAASDPENPVPLHLEWTVGTGSLLLGADRVVEEVGTNNSVLFCTYNGFHVETDLCGLQRVEFFLKLQSVCVFDFYTPGTVYAQVVTPLDPMTREPMVPGPQASPIPFFQLTVLRSPMEVCDLTIDAEAYPLEIVWSTDLVARILRMFDVRTTSMTALGVGTHLAAASAHSKSASSAEKSGPAAGTDSFSAAASSSSSSSALDWTPRDLAFQIGSMMLVTASVKIHAPKLVIPRDLADKTAKALVVDLGVVTVSTALSGADIARLKACRKAVDAPASAAMPPPVTVADLYRNWQVRFGSLQAFFRDGDRSEPLVDEFDMVWKVLRCVVPLPGATATSISGTLPELELRASADRILAAVDILSPVLRKFILLVDQLRHDLSDVAVEVRHMVRTGAKPTLPPSAPAVAEQEPNREFVESESVAMSNGYRSLEWLVNAASGHSGLPFDWTKGRVLDVAFVAARVQLILQSSHKHDRVALRADFRHIGVEFGLSAEEMTGHVSLGEFTLRDYTRKSEDGSTAEYADMVRSGGSASSLLPLFRGRWKYYREGVHPYDHTISADLQDLCVTIPRDSVARFSRALTERMLKPLLAMLAESRRTPSPSPALSSRDSHQAARRRRVQEELVLEPSPSSLPILGLGISVEGTFGGLRLTLLSGGNRPLTECVLHGSTLSLALARTAQIQAVLAVAKGFEVLDQRERRGETIASAREALLLRASIHLPHLVSLLTAEGISGLELAPPVDIHAEARAMTYILDLAFLADLLAYANEFKVLALGFVEALVGVHLSPSSSSKPSPLSLEDGSPSEGGGTRRERVEAVWDRLVRVEGTLERPCLVVPARNGGRQTLVMAHPDRVRLGMQTGQVRVSVMNTKIRMGEVSSLESPYSIAIQEDARLADVFDDHFDYEVRLRPAEEESQFYEVSVTVPVCSIELRPVHVQIVAASVRASLPLLDQVMQRIRDLTVVDLEDIRASSSTSSTAPNLSLQGPSLNRPDEIATDATGASRSNEVSPSSPLPSQVDGLSPSSATTVHEEEESAKEKEPKEMAKGVQEKDKERKIYVRLEVRRFALRLMLAEDGGPLARFDLQAFGVQGQYDIGGDRIAVNLSLDSGSLHDIRPHQLRPRLEDRIASVGTADGELSPQESQYVRLKMGGGELDITAHASHVAFVPVPESIAAFGTALVGFLRTVRFESEGESTLRKIHADLSAAQCSVTLPGWSRRAAMSDVDALLGYQVHWPELHVTTQYVRAPDGDFQVSLATESDMEVLRCLFPGSPPAHAFNLAVPVVRRFKTMISWSLAYSELGAAAAGAGISAASSAPIRMASNLSLVIPDLSVDLNVRELEPVFSVQDDWLEAAEHVMSAFQPDPSPSDEEGDPIPEREASVSPPSVDDPGARMTATPVEDESEETPKNTGGGVDSESGEDGVALQKEKKEEEEEEEEEEEKVVEKIVKVEGEDWVVATDYGNPNDSASIPAEEEKENEKKDKDEKQETSVVVPTASTHESNFGLVFHASVGGVRCTVNTYRGVPLLDVSIGQLQAETSLLTHEQKIESLVDGTVAMQYYNVPLGCWERLVEAFPLSIRFQTAADHEPSLVISSTEEVQVNVTAEVVRAVALSLTREEAIQALKVPRVRGYFLAEQIDRVVIRNYMGLNFFYMMKGAVAEAEKVREVANGSQEDLHHVDERLDRIGDLKDYTLSLWPAGPLAPIHGVQLDGLVGLREIPLEHTVLDGVRAPLVLNAFMEGSSRVLEFRSPIELRNRCANDLTLQLLVPDGQGDQELQDLPVVHSKDRTFIPLHLLSGRLLLRPSGAHASEKWGPSQIIARIDRGGSASSSSYASTPSSTSLNAMTGGAGGSNGSSSSSTNSSTSSGPSSSGGGGGGGGSSGGGGKEEAQQQALQYVPTSSKPSGSERLGGIALNRLSSSSALVACAWTKGKVAPPYVYLVQIDHGKDRRKEYMPPSSVCHHVVTVRAPVQLLNHLPYAVEYRVEYLLRGLSGTAAMAAADLSRLHTNALTCGQLEAGASQELHMLNPHRGCSHVRFRLAGFGWSTPVALDLGQSPSSSTEHRVQLSEEGPKPHESMGASKSPGGGVLELPVSLQWDGGHRLRVTFYSAYWIVNRTHLPMAFKQTQSAELAVGQHGRLSAAAEEHARLRQSGTPDPRFWYCAADAALRESLALPLLYAHVRGKGNISVRLGTSQWSEGLLVTAQTASVSLELREPATNGYLYEVGMTLAPAPAPYWRTKVLTFSPLRILVNRTSLPVVYRQYTCEGDGFVLEPAESIPLYWPDQSVPKKMLEFKLLDVPWKAEEASFSPSSTGWSPAVSLHAGELHVLNMRQVVGGSTARRALLRVETVLEEATLFCVLTLENAAHPAYRLKNRSGRVLLVRQKGSSYEEERVEPHTQVELGLDVPTAEPVLCVRDARSGAVAEYALSGSARLAPLKLGGGGDWLHASLGLVGPTKQLVLSEDRREELDDGFRRNTRLRCLFSLPSLGVSLIDNRRSKHAPLPREVLFATLLGAELHVVWGQSNVRLAASVQDVQVDNQLIDVPMHVMCIPVDGSPPSNSSGPEKPKKKIQSSSSNSSSPFLDEEGEPVFQISMMATEYSGRLVHFEYLSAGIGAMEVKLDGQTAATLLGLMAFVEGQSTTFVDSLQTYVEGLRGVMLENSRPSALAVDDGLRRRATVLSENIFQLPESVQGEPFLLSYRSLRIDPCQFFLTFEYRPGSDFLELRQFENFAGGLLNFDRANIRAAGLSLRHQHVTVPEFLRVLRLHYGRQVQLQLATMFGHWDAIGSPLGLVSNVSTGVLDFISEPLKQRSLAQGLAKGTSSLVENSVGGLLGSGSKVTGTLSSSIASLSLDADYLRQRQQARKSRPRDFSEGVSQGMRGFGLGVLTGVTGVFTQPVLGAAQEGVSGLAKGVGKGVLGLGAKPLAGVMDLMSSTMDAIKTTTEFTKERQRKRLPRFFSPDGRVREYDPMAAWGWALLTELSDPEWARLNYVAHARLFRARGGKGWLVLTATHLLAIDYPRDKNPLWVVAWPAVRAVERLGVSIVFYVSSLAGSGKKTATCESADVAAAVLDQLTAIAHSLHIRLKIKM